MAEQRSPYLGSGVLSAASSRSVLSPQECASPFLSAVPPLVPSHRSSSGRASSSSASTTSSPTTSPSPWAASQSAVLGTSPPALSLPPQAYPIAQGSPLVEPVKIPPAMSRAPASLDGHASRGDETLKYVRRPGATSHLTSPLALFPIANPTRKSFSGAHSNAGNSPRLSPMLSPLMAPTKTPKASSKMVRCDRPGCTLLHSALYGRNALGFRSDLSVALPRLDGEDAELTANCQHSDDSDNDDERPSPHHTHSAFASIPSPDRPTGGLPSSIFSGRHDLPHAGTSYRASPPKPSFVRRASVPNNHYAGSFPSSASTVGSRIPSDSSDHASIHPSPLAQPPDVSSPEFGRGRGRSRQRSPSGERGREREPSAGASRGREPLASRSRSRVRSPPRSGRTSTERGSESRGRRTEASRDDREDGTPRGRRGSSRAPAADGHLAEADEEDDRDATQRGRSGSRRRTYPDIPVFERTPDQRARSLSTSPEQSAAAAPSGRGRRPSVVVKPAPFTTLSSDGVVRTVASSRSRDRDEPERRTDDARGRMRSLRIVEA